MAQHDDQQGVSRQRFLWVVYACLVAVGWWQLLAGNEAYAIGTLGLALGVMLTAAGASKWQRRWITAEFRLAALARGGRSVLSRLLDASWP